MRVLKRICPYCGEKISLIVGNKSNPYKILQCPNCKNSFRMEKVISFRRFEKIAKFFLNFLKRR